MKKLLIGLIGGGIQRSLSPALQEEEAREQGLRLHYQLIDLDESRVGPEVLPELIRAVRIIGFAGLNVTFPCKQAVIPLLDLLSEEARAIGAVNTVVREGDRLVGHNTDGPAGPGASGARCRMQTFPASCFLARAALAPRAPMRSFGSARASSGCRPGCGARS